MRPKIKNEMNHCEMLNLQNIKYEYFIHFDLPTGRNVWLSLPECGLRAGSEQGVPSCSVFTRANFHFVPGLFLSSMFSSTFFLLGI